MHHLSDSVKTRVDLAFWALLPALAWRNIWRSPARSVLTIFALAVGLGFVILYSGLVQGMKNQMIEYATNVASAHIQIHRSEFVDEQDIYATLPWSYLHRLEQRLPAVHFAPRLYASALASTEDTSTGVMLKAIDSVREAEVTSLSKRIRLGRFALSREGADNRHQVIIGTQLARNLQMQVGQELILVTQASDGSIGNDIYQIAGVLKASDPVFDRSGVLLSVEAWRELMRLDSGFHELAVSLDNPAELVQTQQQLQELLLQYSHSKPLDEQGGPVLVRTWRELLRAVNDMLELNQAMIWIMGLIIIIMASTIVLNTMMMAINDRIGEFGILLAIGMQGRWLLAVVLCETLFLAALAVVLGGGSGIAAVMSLEKDGIDFSRLMPDGFDVGGFVYEPVMRTHLVLGDTIGICLMACVVACVMALIPAWRIVHLKPVEALR